MTSGDALTAGSFGGNVRQTGPDVGGSERVLFSFGPFGTDICDGPYRVFRTWHRTNATVIQLTNARLRAVPARRFGLLSVPATKYPQGVRPSFEIPYASIVSMEPAEASSPIALMEVLDIRYRDGDSVQEKSIAGYKPAIRRAYETIAAPDGAAPEPVGRVRRATFLAPSSARPQGAGIAASPATAGRRKRPGPPKRAGPV